MPRKLTISEVRVTHSPADPMVTTGWVVHAEHHDSVKTHDVVAFKLDVTAYITPTLGYEGVGGTAEDFIQECKDYVNNAGNYAGGDTFDNQYDAETWV